jgi:hypothetical protein
MDETVADVYRWFAQHGRIELAAAAPAAARPALP